MRQHHVVVQRAPYRVSSLQRRTAAAERQRWPRLPHLAPSSQPQAGYNQVYQTHFGSQQEGSVVFPADERALLNTLVAAVEAQKRPTIVAGSHGYEGYGNSGDKCH